MRPFPAPRAAAFPARRPAPFRARHRMPQQPFAPLSLGLAGLLLAGCGGSDSGGGGLELVSISVQDGQVWEINRPIQFTFSEPVAFGSVNSSSISVTTLSGKPALGEYRSKGANVVEFQPRCPTQGDLSDAGLEPGGVTYQVVVVGSDVPGGISVTSTAGGVMVTSQKRTFVTPVSTNPSQVFFDVKFGPPDLIVRDLGETTAEATYMQLGAEGDPAKRVYFADAGAPLGIVLEESDLLEDDPLDATIQLAPFNKYVASDGKFSLVLEFDQPVSPAAANINADRLVLQYFDSVASAWVDLDATVTLVKNCTATGARVRIEPIGVIPPGAEVRLRISSAFQDIVGQTPNLEATAFEFPTAPPPLFNGSQAVGDDVFEPFDVSAGQPGSFEDPAPTFAEPLADWSDGALSAVFDFIGTGGPGGDFDLLVEEGSPLLIDTDGTVPVFGGPGFVISGSQNIVNGVLNVRHLLVEEGALIRAEGNNALRIYATGTVTIAGRIDASGFDATSVVQLASANLPEPGSLGACGGGRGGTGSPLTTSSSPKGGDGF
ncbi:MAG TPA: hypothetical protein VJP77_07395, partial [Planctomycetota bacterium]|nr:hypothetical protein [Planctomycetota bacterium]